MSIKKVRQILSTILFILAACLLSFYLGTVYTDRHCTKNKDYDTINNVNKQEQVISGTSRIEVVPKTKTDDPDLFVSNRYVAEVNGETIEVPLKTHKDTSTARVTTEVNLTPVVKQMAQEEYKRNWSIGAGIGYDKSHRDFYVPIVLERNYNVSKSIEAQVGLYQTGKVHNVQLVHKWKF